MRGEAFQLREYVFRAAHQAKSPRDLDRNLRDHARSKFHVVSMMKVGPYRFEDFPDRRAWPFETDSIPKQAVHFVIARRHHAAARVREFRVVGNNSMKVYVDEK